MTTGRINQVTLVKKETKRKTKNAAAQTVRPHYLLFAFSFFFFFFFTTAQKENSGSGSVIV
jgi:hypothetical protein